jgi:hypothetical protein
MIYKLMSVYDSKAEAFMRPFTARSVAEGVRSFSDEVNGGNKENPLVHHPEDFIIYELGDWDEITGVLVAAEKPRAINSGIDVKRSPKEVRTA